MSVAKVKGLQTSDGRFFKEEEKDQAEAHEKAWQERKIISGRVAIIRDKLRCSAEVANKIAVHWVELTGAIEEAGLD
jgi:hypothetical protein